jgi:hypothetical protein
MADNPHYRELDPAQLVKSLTQLDARIRDRFPKAGLARVCQDLIAITRDNSNRVTAIKQRIWWPWAMIPVLLTVGVTFLIWLMLRFVDFAKTTTETFYTVAQAFDACIHIVFVIGGAVFFLITMEDRLKRRSALKAINELRSLIHVVDMHQLTKEPAAVLSGGAPTAHSPKRSLTPFELGRYLDYCAEMLSLIAKVAVLYAQALPDPIIVDAVSDLERLTSNLEQKIWQKITLIHAADAANPKSTTVTHPDGDDAT